MRGMKTKKPKAIHCFKPGSHTTMAGEVIEFSAADVAAIAASYNPVKHRASIVIGHPLTDGPAFGGIEALRAEARGLFADPGEVDPVFAMQVGPHGLNAVSCKFFRPDAPNNPAPGSWYLRHLGFLGEQSPAVKGLDGPAFAISEKDGCVCFQESVEFSDGYDDINVAKLFRNIREFFIGKFSQDEAGRVLPDYQISSLESAATEEIVKDRQELPAFAAPQPKGDEMSAEDKARLAALEAENATLKANEVAFAEAEKKRKTDARHAEHVSFAEGLVKEGKLLPVSKDVTVATMDLMAAQESAVEFGEGDAKKPLLDAYKASLSASPKLVEFGEISGKDKGHAVDVGDAAAVAAKAVEFQESEAKAGRTVSVTAAVAHVTATK